MAMVDSFSRELIIAMEASRWGKVRYTMHISHDMIAVDTFEAIIAVCIVEQLGKIYNTYITCH